MSEDDFRQMIELIRRYGDEMDQWDCLRVTSPAGLQIYVTISMQADRAEEELFRDVDHVWSERT